MTEIAIRVKPRSSRKAILGSREGVWQITLTSPPEGGKANKELIKFLGKSLNVAPSSLELTSGWKSRDKKVEVPILSEVEVIDRLSHCILP